MKVHFIKQTYKTGVRITHFKTMCGKIRHIHTSLHNTCFEDRTTCLLCKKYLIKK